MDDSFLRKAALGAILICACAMAYAATETVNGIPWTYNVSDGKASVGGGFNVTAVPKSTTGAIAIPATLGGYPVTDIGEDAFAGCSGLTSVTIPDCVTTIGFSAFYGCTGIASVTIPQSVNAIGGLAFFACSKLTAVCIESLEAWCEISFDLYSANPLNAGGNLYLNGEEIRDLVIPNGVTVISPYTSFGHSLTTVTIPDSVTSIGGEVFSGCTNLSSIVIGNNITNIGENAFMQCDSLGKILYEHDAPKATYFDAFPAQATLYVSVKSSGWNCEIPGVWNGRNIEYYDGYLALSICENLAVPYDGLAHGLNVLPSIAGSTIRWSMSEKGPYQDEKITFSEVCSSVPIWFEVSNAGYIPYTNSATITISPAPITIVANAKAKTYGVADPALTYTATGLVGSDTVSGALVRDAGEDVGSYDIRQGTLTAGGNYTIRFTGAKLTITKAMFPEGGCEVQGGGEGPDDGTVLNGGLSKFDASAVYDGLGHTIDTYALTAEFVGVMRSWCTVSYALDANGSANAATWSWSPHFFTAVGEHVVWYRVTSPNYNDFIHAAKVTILPRPRYSVKFNKYGGKLPKGKKMAAQKMVYGKATKLRKNVFTRKGFVFAGWATSKANAKKGKIAYGNAQKVKNLRADGGTTTLYAVWAKKNYKVKFYANGGKGKMAVEKFTYGKAKKLSANKFKRKGYVFTGWAKTKANAKAGKVAYKNKKAVKNLVKNGKTVKLYAVWKRK